MINKTNTRVALIRVKGYVRSIEPFLDVIGSVVLITLLAIVLFA